MIRPCVSRTCEYGVITTYAVTCSTIAAGKQAGWIRDLRYE